MPGVNDKLEHRPSVYKQLPGLFAVIDCTELMGQKASDLQKRKTMFSSYKHHDTIKFMISIAPQLYINYVSKAWGGWASDKHITLQSAEFLDALAPGMKVLADRGFTVSRELSHIGVKLMIPVFKCHGRSQMTAAKCFQSE